MGLDLSTLSQHHLVTEQIYIKQTNLGAHASVYQVKHAFGAQNALIENLNSTTKGDDEDKRGKSKRWSRCDALRAPL